MNFKRLAKKLQTSAIIITLERLMIIIAAFLFIIDLSDREINRTNQAWEIVSNKAPGNSGKTGALEYLNSHSCWRTDIFNKKMRKMEKLSARGKRRRSCKLFSLKKRIPLTGINLSLSEGEEGTYLNGIDLQDAILVRANLAGANLLSAKLAGSTLNGAILKETILQETNLEYADLVNAKFQGAFMLDADLSDANLAGANLKGVIQLTCDQLQKAHNWEESYRDKDMACGAKIPKFTNEL